MKAVILAHGEGKGLKPITCSTPRALVPLCGKPAVFHVLDSLSRGGITSATLSLCSMGEQVEDAFDGAVFGGVSLSFSYSEVCLGSGGALRAAADTGDVLVIGASAINSFDFRKAEAMFEKTGADALIITKREEDPRDRTLVFTDENGYVVSLADKPSFESCSTDLVSTGVYILSESVMRHIPDGEKSSLERDILPQLIQAGMRVISYTDEGYWCDVKDIASFMRVQRDMLDGKTSCSLGGHKTLDGVISASSREFLGARVETPCYIGKNVEISDGAVIGAGSVIGDGVSIGRGAKVRGSAVMAGAYIGERATCNAAVICEGARLLAGSAVFEGAAVGAGSYIGESAVVECGVRIWPKKNVESGTRAAYDIKYGEAKKLVTDDEGYCGETNGVISPEKACIIGSSAAAVSEKIVICHNGTPSGEAIAAAFSAGAMSAGTEVYNIGAGAPPLAAYIMSESRIKLGCYVEGGIVTKIRLFSEGGLPLTREQERQIEAGVSRSEYKRAAFDTFGRMHDISSAGQMYVMKLRGEMGEISSVKAEVSSAAKPVREIGRELFSGTRGREKIVFNVSPDGKRLSAYSDETGYVFYEKLLLLGCREEFRKGKDVTLPYSAPMTADAVGEKYGSAVYRYYNCSAGGDEEARERAKRCVFPRDAFYLAAMILRGLEQRKITLGEALAELPKFTAVSRFVPTSKSPAAVLRELCGEQGGLSEGAVKTSEGARVLIRPVKTGKGVMMFVESFKNESAAELCDFYERELMG